MSQLTQVETGLRQVIAAFGQIDIVVNCAGIVLIKPALDNTEQDLDRVFGVNVKGTWLMCQTAAKHMY